MSLGLFLGGLVHAFKRGFALGQFGVSLSVSMIVTYHVILRRRFSALGIMRLKDVS